MLRTPPKKVKKKNIQVLDKTEF